MMKRLLLTYLILWLAFLFGLLTTKLQGAVVVTSNETMGFEQMYRELARYTTSVSGYDPIYESISYASTIDGLANFRLKHPSNSYLDQRRDCDDFARMFAAYMNEASINDINDLGKHSERRGAAAVGTVWVFNMETNYNHMVNIIHTERGWFIIDTQSMNSPIPLNMYQHKQHIKEIVF